MSSIIKTNSKNEDHDATIDGDQRLRLLPVKITEKLLNPTQLPT